MERIRHKLRGRRGESIAEVLIALLVSALGLTLLAGMISYSSNLIKDSRAQTDTFIAEDTRLTVRSDASADGTGKVKVTEKTEMSDQVISLTDQSGDKIDVSCFVNDTMGGTILSYGKSTS